MRFVTQWKNASAEEKSTFEAEVATDRARYQAEMVKYNKVCREHGSYL